MAKKVAKKKKENPEFQYDWPELEHLDDLREERYGRRRLKIVRKWAMAFKTELDWKAEAADPANEGIPGLNKRVERIEELLEKQPPGLKKYLEGLPGFGGWPKFGVTWDLRGSNPFFCVWLLISRWTAWDHIMDRVAIPLDSTPEEVEARVKALAQEYDENQYDV